MVNRLKQWWDAHPFLAWSMLIAGLAFIVLSLLHQATQQVWLFGASVVVALWPLSVVWVLKLRPLWHIYPVYARMFLATAIATLVACAISGITASSLFLTITWILLGCLLAMVVGERVYIASRRKP